MEGVAVAADDLLGQLIRWFEDAEAASQDARRKAERARDYYDNEQWTAAEMAALRKRKQAPLVINYIKRKVEWMRGYERRLRTDPKAYPRTPNEEEGADAATDAIRFVADDNRFDLKRSEVFENLTVEGYGGVEVVVEPGRDRPRIVIRQVPWDRLFHDPHSREKDFSDARYVGTVVWLDRDQALEMFPDGREAIEATFAATTLGDTYEDRPHNWSDNRRTRIRIVQMWYRRGGEWWVCTFTRGGHLTDPQPSPYLDQEGRPACALILQSAYVDRQNNRYGHVQDLIGLQDEINHRRSKALHLLNVRQTFSNGRAVSDVNQAKAELSKPDGHLRLDGAGELNKDFGVLPTGDMALGQFELLQHATAEMQASGPNAAMQGKDPRQQSGRAIQAQQQGGAIEQEPLYDGLRQWSRRVYEAAWMRARQYWTGETWIRVTDDERNIRWVGLNRTITLADELGQMPEPQRAQAMQQMGIMPGDPRLGMPLRRENSVAEIAVDIVVEEGPDVVSLQGEQFEQLAQLAGAGLPIPPDVLIEASSLRNKDKLLERLAESQQQQAQMQAMQAQLGAAQAQADVGKTQAETERTAAQAQTEQVKARTMQIEATAKVVQALKPPEQRAPAGKPAQQGGQRSA